MSTTGPILLRPKRGRWLLFAVGSLGFVLVGVSLVRAGSWVGWPGIVFFGFGFLASIAQMLPGAAFLRLATDGLTICSLFRTHSIRWAEVKKFVVGRMLLRRMVMFNFEGPAGSFPHSPTLRSLNVMLCGFESGLPDSYGLTYEKLADLLNAYKASSHGA